MTRRVALSFLAVLAALMLAGVVLSLGREIVYDTLLFGLLLPGLLGVCGVLITRRQPANPIGWLFCAFAVFGASVELAGGYGLVARDHGLPGGVWAEWLITWSWILDGAFWLSIFLLFPSGRLPGRRWRLVLAAGFLGLAIALPGVALADNPPAYSAGRNPVGVDHPLVPMLLLVGMTLCMGALLSAIVSIGVRCRRARGAERQQLKWFLAAASAFVVVAPFAAALWYTSELVQIAMTLANGSIPIAATVAILRYRLYDIDIVINRALVYGALTATYLGGVLVLQLTLNPLAEESDLAIAGSTLAVAALFRPARTRIQGWVDRRGVVRETVAPAHVSLWLPAPEIRR